MKTASLAFCLAAVTSLTASHPACARVAFTVPVSIELSHLLTIDGRVSGDNSDDYALFSPNRDQFVVRTRHGDIAHDTNVESLLMWTTRAVQNSPSHTHQPRLILERSFHDDWNQISNLQWVGDDQLAFIVGDQAGVQQGFVVNVDTGHSVQVTHSTTDVVSQAIGAQRIVFYAREPVPPATVIDATDQSYLDLTYNRTRPDLAPIGLYQEDLATHFIKRLPGPSIRLLDPAIWLSPSGDFALTRTPAVNAPDHWGRYLTRFADRTYTSSRASDPTSLELRQRTRYVVVDLNNNAVRPLLDAPNSTLAYTGTPARVFWMQGENAVIVSQTYAPLPPLEEQAPNNGREPAVLEVDIRTGSFSNIAVDALRRGASDSNRPIRDLTWDNATQELNLRRGEREGPDHRDVYQRVARGWELVRHDAWPRASAIVRVESLHQPPVLALRDAASGQTTPFFDPAPGLQNYYLGALERVTWTDRNGLAWQGTLVLPVHYVRGRTYPLVVQTHGYSNDEFLIDGPDATSTSFAAQSFANAGMAVLQIIDNGEAGIQTSRESEMVADGWFAGVHALIERGLVDGDHVGVIGWSRTGFHVVGALAKYPDLFAAASISDSVQYNYTQSLTAPGSPTLVANYTAITGGLPSVVGYGDWFSRNPAYRLTGSHAAIRVESIGEIDSMWEPFAMLRQAGRPVIHLYYPQGSHNLIKPSERLASQGGALDWFRFWLQGYEDPAAEKLSQYARWREMRSALCSETARMCTVSRR